MDSERLRLLIGREGREVIERKEMGKVRRGRDLLCTMLLCIL